MKRNLALILFLSLLLCAALAVARMTVVFLGGSAGTVVQTRLPTSDTALGWLCSAGTDRYALVDDGKGTPDDATTYIYDEDANSTDRHGFTAFAIDSSAITKVTTFWRGRVASGTCRIRSILRVNGTDYFGTSTDLTGSWSDRADDFLTNPDTGSAWLEADVEGVGSNPLQAVGVRSDWMESGEEVQCTSVYIEVEYTP